MAGRPRKDCKRKKNGKAADYVPVDVQREVVAAQRLRKVAHTMARRDVTGTPAGLLFIQGFLNEEELNADLQFSILVRRYASITGVKMGPPKVVTLDLTSGTGGRYEPDEAEITAVKAHYAEAHRCLELAGSAAMKEVTSCSVFQNECHERYAYRHGLRALAWLFRVTSGPLALTRGQRKRAGVRGAMAPGARPTNRPDLQDEA
ncbi:MAG: hypothetical protein AAGI06_17570 [Pseudomonadota bacterium]